MAFALSLRVPTTGGPVIVSTTLCVVMFTTLVMGSTTLPVLRRFKMTGSNLMKDFEDREAALGAAAEGAVNAGVVSGPGAVVDKLSNRFVDLDQKYFSRWFAGKWKKGVFCGGWY